jgi:hypothetical protein
MRVAAIWRIVSISSSATLGILKSILDSGQNEEPDEVENWFAGVRHAETDSPRRFREFPQPTRRGNRKLFVIAEAFL